MKTTSTLLRTFVVTAACALPMLASAQWQWVDKDGRKVFSDQPPPAGIADKDILKRPGKLAPAADAGASGVSADAAKPAAAAVPPAPKLSVTDKALAEKKKLADAAEAEKKKADIEKTAKARADNCTRAKQAKATFDSGVRVSRTNEKGEREILDDTGRAAEVSRLQGIIETDCAKS